MTDIPLKFGIDGIDGFISPPLHNPQLSTLAQTWTAAIQGPDGCGKSILALHLASRYFLDNVLSNSSESNRPAVVYLSTDLSYQQATSQWYSFGLDRPARRQALVEDNYYMRRTPLPHKDIPIRLECLSPVLGERDDKQVVTSAVTPRQSIEQFLLAPSEHVWFVDLQSETAGDDWGWLNQFVGLLAERDGNAPRHLLIVDAVEGIETLVGRRDAYGTYRSRRSRVAQLIRNAARKGVHVLFIVEEPRPNARLPEQFVTDLVIRVRQRLNGDYSQRTIEIEKCRAMAHVRGEHELSIRTGHGEFTGKQPHLDNPRIVWQESDSTRQLPQLYLAHVHVVQSLHRINREIREDCTMVPDLIGEPSFNLPQIDKLFQRSTRRHRESLLAARVVTTPAVDDARNHVHQQSDVSLSQGCLTFLLGDSGTHKGRLSRRFLSEAFTFHKDGRVDRDNSGVALLITNRLLDHNGVFNRLASHWNIRTFTASDQQWILSRILCQRLGTRHIASATLGDIVRRYIHYGQQILDGKASSLRDIFAKRPEDRRLNAERIRIVIEDWSALLSSHQALTTDPMILESLITIIRREGVQALVVSTQPSQPSIPLASQTNLDLRAFDEAQLLTWTVPFFGERRTAITVIAGANEPDVPAIYELVPHACSNDYEGVSINPHFEIYRDVDAGRPSRVPLVVRLYVGNHEPSQQRGNAAQFPQMVRDSLSQVFAPAEPTQDVVQFDSYERYDRFFAFATELTNSRLDHTVILQIDEFWSAETQYTKAFAPLHDNIGLPLKIEGQPRAARRARVTELLDLIGLSDKANAYPAQLSGGQKQRVGIARALAARPALLLSDEATSALDPETTDSILELLKDINRRLGLTILLITHEMGVVKAIADRVAVLDGGRIVEHGPVWRVFASPQAAVTQSLLRSLQPSLPDDLRSRLKPGRGRRTVIRVTIAGDEARRPILAELALKTGASVALLHGGVDHVQGEPVGRLFLEVPGDDAGRLEAILNFLRHSAGEVEVLGHVAGDA